MDDKIFQCTVCGEKIGGSGKKCSATSLSGERRPVHCGREMMEVPE